MTTVLAALALTCAGQARPGFVLQAPISPSREQIPLQKRLQRGDEVNIVFFGDSLTFGWGLERPDLDGFPALVTRALEARFPKARINAHVIADPAAAAWWALTFLRSHVLPLHPDLAIVQFGGNDAAQRPIDRPVGAFEEDIRQILWELRQANVQAILCLPPYELKNAKREVPFMDALRRCAAEARVPLADLNAAVRAVEFDWRGLFPVNGWGHPNWHGHLQMAREIWMALGELVPAPCSISVSLGQRVEVVPKDSLVYVPVIVSTTTPGPAQLTVDLDGQEQRERITVPEAGKGILRAFPVTVPADPLGPRACSTHRIHVLAEVNGAVGFTAGRLTLTRIVPAAPGVPSGELDWKTVAEHGGKLDRASVQIGQAHWTGPEDCSARFAAFCDGRQLCVMVLVRDDVVTVGTGRWLADNDCVEIMLDLNPDNRRGLPYHTPRTAVLLVAPPLYPDWGMQLTTLDRFDPAYQFRADPIPYYEGYGFRLTLPLEALGLEAGQKHIGFDIVLDDADDTPWRQTQLVWSGEWDSALVTSRYAVLSLDPSDKADMLQLTIR